MHQPRYIGRDSSWLQFNYRVLQEARDSTVPLYERLKFLAIYSSNLDEFFRVRVSAMRSFKSMKDLKDRFSAKPKRILKEIQAEVNRQQEEFGQIFTGIILPELAHQGIRLVPNEEYTAEQIAFASDYFDKNLLNHIDPHLVFEEDVEVWLENRALYLVLQLDDEFKKVVILPIPQTSPRFVELPPSEGSHCVTFVDDIIRANIEKLLPENHIRGVYAIKMSRDAELYLGDEFSGDLIARLEERVKQRGKGLPTRFLYDKTMPPELLKRLRKSLGVSKYDLIPGARYHNFHDFFGFPDPSNNPLLHDKALPPGPHPVLEKAESMFDEILDRDVMLHFPYHSYDYIPRLIDEAADRPDVKRIYITLYRVARKSMVATALLNALDKGKEVFAFIEAKARFDEESNLFWGRKLQQAGAEVRYSFPGIKVHSKLMLIERTADSATRYLAYLGTGNFNEKTAKLYTDHALLTADERVAPEVARVFDILEGKILAPQCRHLLVSPFTSRPGLMELVDKEIKNAREGKDAWMILKMNSLEDRRMVKKLYEASEAGVKIKMIIRGICVALPGVPEMSENIEAISIIDRFLEHGRVYIFANGGEEKMYLASADWMTRNLDRRVEVIFPIYDEAVKEELRRVIDILLGDNTKARILDAEQSNAYVHRLPGEIPRRAQTELYDMFNTPILDKDQVVT